MHRSHRGLVWSLRAGLLALFGASLDCATLDKIDTNTCGNGVVDYEKGEDCDGFAVSGAPCRPKGQENACHLDCSPGDAGTAGKCPTGWGCGVADKVCHAPGDGYVVKNGFASAESAFKLMIGDYDGDGRKDILSFGRRGPTGTARARLHFAGSTTLSSLGIPSSIGPGTFSDVDGDGKDDITFANLGYGVLRGNAQRVLSPLALPISKVNQPVRLTPLYLRPEVDPTRDKRTATAIAVFDAQAVVIVIIDPGGQSTLAPIPMPVGADPSSFHFLAGSVDAPLRLFSTQVSACGDTVAWVQGGNRITIDRPCARQGTRILAQNPSLARSVDVPGLVAVAVGDIDGDGVDDIVAQVDERGDKGTRRRMKVLSAPNFEARDADLDVPDLPTTVGEIGTSAELASRLLGVRDLNADGRADLIFGSIIALSTAGLTDAGGKVSYRQGYIRRSAPWREIATGDFDGDGRVDVVGSNASTDADAGSSGNSDLDVLLAPGFQYVPQVLTTGAPASRLSVGDFDGDGTDDLAFGVQNIDGTADLRVAFGKRNATPYDVVTVASAVAGLSQVVNQTQGRLDGISDDIHDIGFVAQTTENNQPVTRLYVALGGADRQPTTRISSGYAATGAVAGRFRGASVEILSLGSAPGTGTNVAGGSGILDASGYFENCPLDIAPAIAVQAGSSLVFGLVSTSAARDQLVLGVSEGKESRFGLLGLSLGETPIRGAGGTCDKIPLTRTSLPEIRARLDDFSEVRGGDIDGDGLPDLLVLAGALSARTPIAQDSRDAGTPQVIEGTKVYALFGQREGGYKNPAELPVGDAPGGIALLRADDGRALLATITSKGIGLFRIDGSNNLVALPVTIEGDATGIQPAPRPSAIAGGDFDGDGLDDIAIVADGVLRVLFRKQCAEASCRKVGP